LPRYENVTANVSAPKANVPEQLGLSLPAHDRASWRVAGTPPPPGVSEID